MKAIEHSDQPTELGQKALSLMSRYGIPASPKNYAVWYDYAGRHNPLLARAIDRAISENRGFSEEVNARLSQQLENAVSSEEELNGIRSRMEEALAKMIACVETAINNAAAYSQSLDSFNGMLATSSSLGDLANLVTEIMVSTRSMIDLNEQLTRRLTVTVRDSARLKENLDQLRHEAMQDHLTKLFNRKMFDAALDQARHESNQSGEPLCLLMIDIDHFKDFNDRHGHQMGDQVLKLVGHVLLNKLRDHDTAARYGGEEFSVIIPGADLDQAIEKAEEIRRLVAGRRITNRRTGAILGQVTLSVGVAQYRPLESATDLIERADESLYLAKQQGRNAVRSESDLETPRSA